MTNLKNSENNFKKLLTGKLKPTNISLIENKQTKFLMKYLNKQHIGAQTI
ncbi:hypothetical protein [Acinetobacter phage P577]|nr:hypothetical protein ACQ36_gp071 [Acinetobacter phage YMC13/03/R2096]AIW02862.1 hypothetical protein BPABA577_01280 [Acinetobacter phage YMC13/03/R2096]WNT46186.1 hypothetical protein [Acinetobacter phage P577]